MTEIKTDGVERCETCRFWQVVELAPYWTGDCRRNPPSMQGHIAPHGNATYQEPRGAIWPTVRPSDWCGEYQPLLTRIKSESGGSHD